MVSRRNDPDMRRIMDKVRSVRMHKNIGRNEAADAADMNHSYWTHIESGARSATVRVASRMARAVGMRLDVVPANEAERVNVFYYPSDTPAPEPRHAPEVERIPTRRASPLVMRLLGRIRAYREAANLTHEQAGDRVGWAKSTWSNLERGYAIGQHIGADRIELAASAVGLRLELIAEHHAPLLELDEGEVAALRGLVRWYLDHAPRPNSVLAGIADKIREADREETAA